MEHSPFSTASVMDLSALAFLSRRTQPFGTSKVTAFCVSRSTKKHWETDSRPRHQERPHSCPTELEPAPRPQKVPAPAT